MESLYFRIATGHQEFDEEWQDIVDNKPPPLTSDLKKVEAPIPKYFTTRFGKNNDSQNK